MRAPLQCICFNALHLSPLYLVFLLLSLGTLNFGSWLHSWISILGLISGELKYNGFLKYILRITFLSLLRFKYRWIVVKVGYEPLSPLRSERDATGEDDWRTIIKSFTKYSYRKSTHKARVIVLTIQCLSITHWHYHLPRGQGSRRPWITEEEQSGAASHWQDGAVREVQSRPSTYCPAVLIPSFVSGMSG